MKYRLLTDEELVILEEDLKQFLIVNHVYKEEWAKMNQENPELAQELIVLFSDEVLQIVYEKVKFLEFRSPESCFIFHCKPDQVELISMQRKTPNSPVDFSTPESIHDALVKFPNEITFLQSEKKYSEVREKEIHRMLEQGCLNSTASFWNSIEEVVKFQSKS